MLNGAWLGQYVGLGKASLFIRGQKLLEIEKQKTNRVL